MSGCVLVPWRPVVVTLRLMTFFGEVRRCGVVAKFGDLLSWRGVVLLWCSEVHWRVVSVPSIAVMVALRRVVFSYGVVE